MITKNFIGSSKDWIEALIVSLAMFVALVAFKLIETVFIGPTEFNYLEFYGTLFGLITVWLARTQNILNWPFGVICVTLLGLFFFSISIPGQDFLFLIFFLGISIWGWWNWAYGGKDKNVLPVTFLNWKERGLWFLGIVIVSLATYFSIDLLVPDSQYPYLDAIVVGASIIAQILLARKNVESWWLWFGPVNALSIILFGLAGAYTVTALYIAYFIHAWFSIRKWTKDAKEI